MIRRLHLVRYGRFRDTRLDLGDVTVFLGPNESGKPPIADALLDVRCRPQRNKRAGQALAARYGEDREVRPEPAITERTRIDAEEYQGLLGVSSGDLSIQLPKTGAWLDALKAQLFTGGIDPRALAQILDRDARPSRATVSGKRLIEAQTARDRARAALQELKDTRAATLQHERRLVEGSAKLARLGAELEERRKESEAIRHELAQQGLIGQRRRCMDALRVLDEVAAADAAREHTTAGSRDETPRLEALERAAGEREEKVRSARQSAEHARFRLEQVASAVEEAARDLESSRWRAELAQRLLSPAADPVRPAGPASGGIRTALVILGVLLVLGGAACFALLDSPLSFVLGALAVVLAVPALSAGLSSAGRAGAAARARAEHQMREAWRRETGESPTEAPGEILLRENVRYETARATQARQAREMEDLRAAVELGQEETAGALRDATAAAAELASFLKARGVSTTREYAALRARRARELEVRARLEETLKGLVSEYGVAGREELGRECRVRIQNLDQSITARALDEPTRRRLEARQRELEADIVERTRAWTALSAEHSRERGRIQGSLGNLPERIRAAEQELERCTAAVAEMETDRKAAALAAQIMGTIAVDSDGRLDGLSAEIAELYAGIVCSPAHSPDFEVRLDGLDLGSASARDASGSEQSYANLSQGTRDAVALAARLALATKTGRTTGILVLDEPFLALDHQRVEGALRVLRSFRERQGWQMVILTKDPQLAVSARAVFGESARIHELEGLTTSGSA